MKNSQQPFKVIKNQGVPLPLNQKRPYKENSGEEIDPRNFNQLPQDMNKLPQRQQEKGAKKFENLMDNESNVQSQEQQKKQYDTFNFKYSSEGYTYQANQFLRKIANEKHAQDIACKYPLYKMLRSITKKFMLNELEIIFFAYILEENAWALDDYELKSSAYYLKDFLNITEVKEPLEYKTVLLYLVLNAYAVKYYLNDSQDMHVFDAHLAGVLSNFGELFKYWSKKYASTSLKIQPKKLNYIFRKLSVKPSDGTKKQQDDYNSIVDAIIQISPPYNNEKSDNSLHNHHNPQQSQQHHNSNQNKQFVPQEKNSNQSANNYQGNSGDVNNNKQFDDIFKNKAPNPQFPNSGFNLSNQNSNFNKNLISNNQNQNQIHDILNNLKQQQLQQDTNKIYNRGLIDQSRDNDLGGYPMLSRNASQISIGGDMPQLNNDRNFSKNMNMNQSALMQMFFQNSISQQNDPFMMSIQKNNNGKQPFLFQNLPMKSTLNTDDQEKINQINLGQQQQHSDIKTEEKEKQFINHNNSKHNDDDIPNEVPSMKKLFSASVFLSDQQ